MDGIALPDGHVRIGRAELRAGNAGTAHAGDRVTLCIRPSDIALGRAGKAGLEASVQAMEFRGGHYKATLFVDTLETTLQADVSRAQRDALHLAVATRITVNLPEERAVLFVK